MIHPEILLGEQITAGHFNVPSRDWEQEMATHLEKLTFIGLLSSCERALNKEVYVRPEVGMKRGA